MALIWERVVGKQRYEVRTAGRSIRLYTNNVLHSQYHPDVLFGGGYWDLLGLPALWIRKPRLSGILLLGLGGGAVARQLQELVKWHRFIALERNPVHLEIARRFFGLDLVPVDAVRTDARHWIETYAGDGFDLIIDDLFSDNQDEARRAVPFSRSWYYGLRDLLSDDGMLVVNFADESELSYRLARIRAVKRDFDVIYKLTLPAYGNAIAALVRGSRTPSELEHALGAIKPRRRWARLRYHLTKLDL